MSASSNIAVSEDAVKMNSKKSFSLENRQYRDHCEPANDTSSSSRGSVMGPTATRSSDVVISPPRISEEHIKPHKPIDKWTIAKIRNMATEPAGRRSVHHCDQLCQTSFDNVTIRDQKIIQEASHENLADIRAKFQEPCKKYSLDNSPNYQPLKRQDSFAEYEPQVVKKSQDMFRKQLLKPRDYKGIMVSPDENELFRIEIEGKRPSQKGERTSETGISGDKGHLLDFNLHNDNAKPEAAPNCISQLGHSKEIRGYQYPCRPNENAQSEPARNWMKKTTTSQLGQSKEIRGHQYPYNENAKPEAARNWLENMISSQIGKSREIRDHQYRSNKNAKPETVQNCIENTNASQLGYSKEIRDHQYPCHENAKPEAAKNWIEKKTALQFENSKEIRDHQYPCSENSKPEAARNWVENKIALQLGHSKDIRGRQYPCLENAKPEAAKNWIEKKTALQFGHAKEIRDHQYPCNENSKHEAARNWVENKIALQLGHSKDIRGHQYPCQENAKPEAAKNWTDKTTASQLGHSKEIQGHQYPCHENAKPEAAKSWIEKKTALQFGHSKEIRDRQYPCNENSKPETARNWLENMIASPLGQFRENRDRQYHCNDYAQPETVQNCIEKSNASQFGHSMDVRGHQYPCNENAQPETVQNCIKKTIASQLGHSKEIRGHQYSCNENAKPETLRNCVENKIALQLGHSKDIRGQQYSRSAENAQSASARSWVEKMKASQLGRCNQYLSNKSAPSGDANTDFLPPTARRNATRYSEEMAISSHLGRSKKNQDYHKSSYACCTQSDRLNECRSEVRVWEESAERKGDLTNRVFPICKEPRVDFIGATQRRQYTKRTGYSDIMGEEPFAPECSDCEENNLIQTWNRKSTGTNNCCSNAQSIVTGDCCSKTIDKHCIQTSFKLPIMPGDEHERRMPKKHLEKTLKCQSEECELKDHSLSLLELAIKNMYLEEVDNETLSAILRESDYDAMAKLTSAVVEKIGQCVKIAAKKVMKKHIHGEDNLFAYRQIGAETEGHPKHRCSRTSIPYEKRSQHQTGSCLSIKSPIKSQSSGYPLLASTLDPSHCDRTAAIQSVFDQQQLETIYCEPVTVNGKNKKGSQLAQRDDVKMSSALLHCDLDCKYYFTTSMRASARCKQIDTRAISKLPQIDTRAEFDISAAQVESKIEINSEDEEAGDEYNLKISKDIENPRGKNALEKYIRSDDHNINTVQKTDKNQFGNKKICTQKSMLAIKQSLLVREVSEPNKEHRCPCITEIRPAAGKNTEKFISKANKIDKPLRQYRVHTHSSSLREYLRRLRSPGVLLINSRKRIPCRVRLKQNQQMVNRWLTRKTVSHIKPSKTNSRIKNAVDLLTKLSAITTPETVLTAEIPTHVNTPKKHSTPTLKYVACKCKSAGTMDLRVARASQTDRTQNCKNRFRNPNNKSQVFPCKEEIKICCNCQRVDGCSRTTSCNGSRISAYGTNSDHRSRDNSGNSNCSRNCVSNLQRSSPRSESLSCSLREFAVRNSTYSQLVEKLAKNAERAICTGHSETNTKSNCSLFGRIKMLLKRWFRLSRCIMVSKSCSNTHMIPGHLSEDHNFENQFFQNSSSSHIHTHTK